MPTYETQEARPRYPYDKVHPEPQNPQPYPQTSQQSKQSEDRYAATAWGGTGTDLSMPSGQLAYVRKPGIEQLIAAGIINDLDSLSGIVDGLITKAEGGVPPKVDVEKIMSDSSQMDAMFHLIDRVVCHTVIKPEVHMTPNDRTSRKPGVIYCDMIDIEDRLFIFNYVTGGVTSVAAFREESAKHMASMGAVQEDEVQAQ